MEKSPFPQQVDMNGDTTSKRVEQVGSSLHDTIDKVTDPARSAVDRASASAHETVDRLSGSASRLARRLDEKTRKLTDAPMKALDYSKTQVQSHPLEAIGAALLVGFVVGRLTASRY